jgi:hypothetical protein
MITGLLDCAFGELYASIAIVYYLAVPVRCAIDASSNFAEFENMYLGAHELRAKKRTSSSN